jgi:hypothetical protein
MSITHAVERNINFIFEPPMVIYVPRVIYFDDSEKNGVFEKVVSSDA